MAKRKDRRCPWCLALVPRGRYKQHVNDHARTQLGRMGLSYGGPKKLAEDARRKREGEPFSREDFE